MARRTVLEVTLDPTDADISQLLVAAPEQRWTELWDAYATLRGEDEHGHWAGGETVRTIEIDGVEQPVRHLPYVVTSEAVDRMIQCIYALGANLPFDWSAWDGLRRYPGGRGLESAPVAESVRMVTALVRADRFSEGTILAAFEDGTVDAVMSRLRRWYDEERAES